MNLQNNEIIAAELVQVNVLNYGYLFTVLLLWLLKFEPAGAPGPNWGVGQISEWGA